MPNPQDLLAQVHLALHCGHGSKELKGAVLFGQQAHETKMVAC